MTYVVIDLETTTRTSYKRKANPFDSDNKIIIAVYKSEGASPQLQYAKEGLSRTSLDFLLTNPQTENLDLLVGQNIKFDLLYLWESQNLQHFFRRGGKIWDTMLAEYLLTAQQSTYASLDTLATKYGGTLKDDQVKKMWEVGLATTEIDPDILLPYAEQDVVNTEIVYLKQIEEAKRLGMLPLIEGYMDHLLALTEMEFNGLYVDMKKAEQLRRNYEYDLICLGAKLDLIVKAQNPDWPFEHQEFDPGSPEQVSAMLFGTPIKTLVKKHVLDEDGNPKVYGPKAQKAGQVIYKQELIEYIPKSFRFSTIGVEKYKKGGVYTAGEDTLNKLKEKGNSEAKLFIETILKYRETRKLLTTYLYGEDRDSGLIPLVQPDGCIHHTLDTVQTKTGRVNSSKPNLQNVPPDVREIFTSRFGKDGRIIEGDYNQLEVCVQAYLAQSMNMIQDIKTGVDFHAKRLGYAERLSYEEVMTKLKEDSSGEWGRKRKEAKTVSFQKAYGAHPEKIAKETNLPVATVELIFDEEDQEYPEIRLFNDNVEAGARRSRIPTKNLISIRDKDTGQYIERDGVYQGVGFYQSITGKRYHFLEKASTSAKLRSTPGRDPYLYFSGPEIANYPVQGTAADIVALSIGRVWRVCQGMHSVKMINEVHDSLLLDCSDKETAGTTVEMIKSVLEDVHGTFKEKLGVGFNVPIKVDMKIGTYWGEDNEQHE